MPESESQEPPILNRSGQGSNSQIPDEIRGWNWGAFLLNWIWGIRNQTLVALLMFIPLVNIVMPFILGAKGNEWAWRNKRWESAEEFKRIQRKWTIAALIIYGIGFFLGVTLALFFSASNNQFLQNLQSAEQGPAQ